ncbi:MAG TPA: 5-(carboxyamino)imidazole ribonucleotide synthase [Alphaproteobacteria bacterium]|nr:5-(carboxyamino)imidazole ribonucleotide synthase [Alphaproteobacteria bacterium]HNS44737.1 5-(carboxyamino)imidazole ribonucleotide synthase [Alphaproteobacteria bacterium]
MTKSAQTLGILGGGQLGRMSALAAARLGIKTHIFCPETDSPASHVAAKTFVASYDDKDALKDFAKSVDVISYEFENIPVETVRYLKKFKPVYPDEKLLEIAQHRWKEKQFLNDIGIPTAKWGKAKSTADVKKQIQQWGVTDCIIKTTRFGYDGKGQAKIDKNTDIGKAWASLKTDEAIVEFLVPFKHEISVIVARDQFGKTESYVPVLNDHKNHILSKTTAPAPLDDALLARATKMAQKLAKQVGLVGVLGLELFVTKDGQIIANEIAPRTHNSGHWTIDACPVSQFENHVRTVCGLPVGKAVRHSDAVMLNLIGDDVALVNKYLGKANACIHLYGKPEVRAGRKMGHITLLKGK